MARGKARLARMASSSDRLERLMHLRKLVEECRPQARRGARRQRFTQLPILGSISAGLGDPVDPVGEGTIPVDLEAMNIPRTARTFALKVKGDSMKDAHILDGDTVIVETREPKFGDIVAAVIDGETTLKRFMTQNGEIFLKAENPAYPDRIPLNNLVIQGVVRAVLRVCNPGRRSGD